ncbi:uncharacterized protein K02A2.6 [Rhipicephalus sanguineus]|uniref:uncharacterized protein K02A2.6 n=1 Tax=Rhipicephalus sanguineus TaxID=34632 RepID=UPI0018952692|nr:uncharacterized protein K02A2.6 [Rhipicephalus sanguineus]
MTDSATAATNAATGFSLKPPQPFTFDQASEWPAWILEFDDYRFASGLVHQEREMQVRTLLYVMGRQARQIFNTFSLSTEDSKNFDLVKAKFDSHFVQARNVVYESACFNRREQEPSETVDQYVTALYNMADRCDYGDLRDRLIRDRFVLGLRDKKLCEALQMDANLTLAMALAKARQKESVHKQQQQLLQASGEPSSFKSEYTGLDAVSHNHRGKGKNLPRPHNNATKSNIQSCGYCGGAPHSRSLCPAKTEKCSKCNTRGHFARVCRKVPSRDISTLEQGTSAMFLGAVNQPADAQHDSRLVEVDLNGYSLIAKIDTGAQVSVVPATFAGIPEHLQPASETLSGPSGRAIQVVGKFDATITWRSRRSNQVVYVVQHLKHPLLGLPAIESLGLVKFLCATERVEERYPELFNGLGLLPGAYTIRLNPAAVPYSVTVARRIPVPLRKAVEQEIISMQQQGVIRPVEGPTDWCAGIVPVVKPSGGVRICVDFTRLNSSVLRERFPLPSVEQTLALLGEATVFSRLDANSGFHQIPLSPACQDLTTFITPVGRFCFTRLPFGITSAPEYFQKRMSEILSGLTGVVNLMDDILVFGRDQAEHDGNLDTTLKKLASSGITLNRSKCAFSVKEVTFLGCVISKGIRPDPKKVEAIKCLPPPTDVAGVRRILGMVNHLARFLPNLAERTAALRVLLKKTSEWTWGPAQEKDFQNIKDLICSDQCLAKYHPEYPTTLSADASAYGLGAVLLQVQPDGNNRPVAFASRSLTPAETRYAQIEKEALALTWGAERFEEYLRGLTATFQTDHQPLITLLGKESLDLLPPRMVSDNGPQFSSSAFAEFAKAYGFNHTTSSPVHPQANGEAERAVQTVKHLLEKADDPYLALLAYRDTPGPTGFSPAKLLMGRQLRSRVPAFPALLVPGNVDNKQVTKRDLEAKQRQRRNFNRRHAAKDLPALSPNTRVWVRDLKCEGEITQQADTPRSYWVQTERGHVRRNRKMLVPLPASQKKAQPLPSSLFSDTDDEDFEPSTVAGPLAALYNGASSQRGDPLRTDSNNSLPKPVNDAAAETSRVPATTTRSGRRVFVPERYGVVT